MKKQVWISLGLTSIILLSSCIEHKKKEKPSSKAPVSKEESKFVADKDYKVLRIYSGRIPCADCSGIEQRLVLKGDTMGIYRLTEVYRNATEDGDATIVSTGEWKIKNTEKERKIFLSQGHLGDSIRTASYVFTDKKLVQKSIDDETITSAWNYTLRRSK